MAFKVGIPLRANFWTVNRGQQKNKFPDDAIDITTCTDPQHSVVN